MASHTQALAATHQAPFETASALWRGAALAAHLAFLSVAAMSIGFGYFSLEMARWSTNVAIEAFTPASLMLRHSERQGAGELTAAPAELIG